MPDARFTGESNSHEPEVRTVQEALGQSEVFLTFQEELSRVAHVERPVLIIGERGTGKELAATRLHFLSQRWQHPFVALNCSALPATLIESELFGHEAGAFTGAAQRRSGRFEMASSGTLFLDEIGLIPTETQEKILRAVEYGSFERVGSSRPIQVDVRIIGATNADLPAMARTGEFRRDLLDRLSFEVLFVPPLRDRAEDIMLLANHFAARMAFELDCDEMPEFSDRSIAALERYPWPGNVRELKNVVERSVYRAQSPLVETIAFDPFLTPYAPPPAEQPVDEGPGPVSPEPSVPPPAAPIDEDLPLLEAVRRLEVRLLKRALEDAKYNQRKASTALGLTYHQFRGLYRKHAEEVKE
jgi:psp operon transcriptional activator